MRQSVMALALASESVAQIGASLKLTPSQVNLFLMRVLPKHVI